MMRLAGGRGFRLIVSTACFFAAGMQAFVLASCSSDIPDSTGPLFAAGNTVYAAAAKPVPLFEARSRLRDRALSRVGDSIVYWDAENNRLLQRGGALFAPQQLRLEADAVFIQGRQVLSRGFVYHEGTGFDFVLANWTGRSVETLFTCALDLFPSDVLFMDDGRVFVAGVNQAGDESAIYLFDPRAQKAERLVALRRESSFPRLVRAGDWLLLFHSARSLEEGDPRLHRALLQGEVLPVFEPFPAPLPETLTGVFFGYGLSLGGEAYLPLAEEDGTRSLLPVRPGDESPFGEALEGSGGVFLPLGPQEGGDSCWYIAFDPLSETSARVLTRFDGFRFFRCPILQESSAHSD